MIFEALDKVAGGDVVAADRMNFRKSVAPPLEKMTGKKRACWAVG
jgi:hypothetical protein